MESNHALIPFEDVPKFDLTMSKDETVEAILELCGLCDHLGNGYLFEDEYA